MMLKHNSMNTTNQYFLDRQAKFESNARSYPRKIPIAIGAASGSYVTDVEGRQYLDCLSGAGTLALGHNHPDVIEAINSVVRSGLPLHTLDLTTPLKDEFSATLLELLPGNASDWRLQFCGPTGADAVEAALKLAKTASSRATILSFSGGYHGMTHGALSVTGNLAPKRSVSSLMPGVQFMPFPYSYRCPLGLGGTQAEEALSTYMERFLDDVESGVTAPAAVIVEAIQGEGGVIPAPDAWLRRLRMATQARGIALILDEVQAGIGRSGDWFAFERSGIVPDMIVISKAIGGGLPLAVLAYRKQWDEWLPGAHTGTFRGNQMAMAAGLATLRVINRDGLLSQVAAHGEQLRNAIETLAGKHACIGEVRGRGLMLGIEIVDKSRPADRLGSYPANPTLTARIQAECFANGLILERGGRNGTVLRLLPPLNVSQAELFSAIERLDLALSSATMNSAATGAAQHA
jgi:diaminobutyrate-2-oxoglutarate transaminase